MYIVQDNEVKREREAEDDGGKEQYINIKYLFFSFLRWKIYGNLFVPCL